MARRRARGRHDLDAVVRAERPRRGIHRRPRRGHGPGLRLDDLGQTPEGQRFESDVHAIDDATETQLRRLATALVRVERFGEGSQAASFESGRMAAIARRAEVLADL